MHEGFFMSEIRLSEKFDEAIQFARELHDGHLRKKSNIPYFSHLMAVAAIVLDNEGDNMLTGFIIFPFLRSFL